MKEDAQAETAEAVMSPQLEQRDRGQAHDAHPSASSDGAGVGGFGRWRWRWRYG
jgi:hypothetical protein